MATNNSWNQQIAAANSAITLNSGTNAVSISTDASNTTVNVATGGAVKTATFGSVNSTSATTVQSGSGALNVTATGGALTINSGTGALSISNDASNTTVNIASGGAAKVVQLGSTNGASSLALRYGTADMTMASATGTVMSALDTGEITYPLQPAFLAYASAVGTDVTGDGTVYTLVFGTERFDQNGDFDGTSTFTAPVSGRYFLSSFVLLQEIIATNTVTLQMVTSNITYTYGNYGAALAGNFPIDMNVLADMDAADTVTVAVTVGNGAKVTNTYGGAGDPRTVFSGNLEC